MLRDLRAQYDELAALLHDALRLATELGGLEGRDVSVDGAWCVVV